MSLKHAHIRLTRAGASALDLRRAILVARVSCITPITQTLHPMDQRRQTIRGTVFDGFDDELVEALDLRNVLNLEVDLTPGAAPSDARGR